MQLHSTSFNANVVQNLLFTLPVYLVHMSPLFALSTLAYLKSRTPLVNGYASDALLNAAAQNVRQAALSQNVAMMLNGISSTHAESNL